MTEPMSIDSWLALASATYFYLFVCFNLRTIGYLIGWVGIRVMNWSFFTWVVVFQYGTLITILMTVTINFATTREEIQRLSVNQQHSDTKLIEHALILRAIEADVEIRLRDLERRR